MTMTLQATFAAAAIALLGASTPTCIRCGEERWDVKTLSDTAARSVNMHPQKTTIAALDALPKPNMRRVNGRVVPTEFQTFTVVGCLRGWKREDEDQDLHLVLVDGAATMIAEIPDPQCEGVCETKYGPVYADMRRRMIDAFGEPRPRFRHFRRMPKVVVTGVAFFDVEHGQTGVAPNAVELHPVLSMMQTGWCNKRYASINELGFLAKAKP